MYTSNWSFVMFSEKRALIFISFLKHVNLHKIYIEIEKTKIFILMSCVGLGIFLPGKLCLRELKGSEAYLVTLL